MELRICCCGPRTGVVGNTGSSGRLYSAETAETEVGGCIVHTVAEARLSRATDRLLELLTVRLPTLVAHISSRSRSRLQQRLPLLQSVLVRPCRRTDRAAHGCHSLHFLERNQIAEG
jgi:hypothetical protein